MLQRAVDRIVFVLNDKRISVCLCNQVQQGHPLSFGPNKKLRKSFSGGSCERGSRHFDLFTTSGGCNYSSRPLNWGTWQAKRCLARHALREKKKKKKKSFVCNFVVENSEVREAKMWHASATWSSVHKLMLLLLQCFLYKNTFCLLLFFSISSWCFFFFVPSTSFSNFPALQPSFFHETVQCNASI